MPYLNQNDHSVILDTFFRYARADEIYGADDTIDLTVLDAQGAPTEEKWEGVPIFYHCGPDVGQRANGSLVGSAKAFRDGDTVIVKFEGESPTVVAIKDQLRPCYAPHGVFIDGLGNIALYESEGDPEDANLNFKDPISWGSARHVWFIGNTYWVNVAGQIKYNPEAGWYQPRNAANEVDCNGLPADVWEFCVWGEAGGFFMLASEGGATSGRIVKQYTSEDGINWTFIGGVFSGLVSDAARLISNDLPVFTIGYWRPEQDRYFMEKDGDQFRLYRIGLKTRFNADGTFNTLEEAWSEKAYAESMVQYTFEHENDFSVQGGLGDLQLIQIY